MKDRQLTDLVDVNVAEATFSPDPVPDADVLQRVSEVTESSIGEEGENFDGYSWPEEAEYDYANVLSPTEHPLIVRHFRQVHLRHKYLPELSAEMRNYIAIAFVPGKHSTRFDCPYVPTSNVRIITMYHCEHGSLLEPAIVVAGHNAVVDKGRTIFGADPDKAFAKDLYPKPESTYPGRIMGIGHDADLIDLALKMDRAIELAAKNVGSVASQWQMPKVLASFPHHYRPTPDQTPAMDNLVKEVFAGTRKLEAWTISESAVITNVDEGHLITVRARGANGRGFVCRWPNDWCVPIQNIKVGQRLIPGTVAAIKRLPSSGMSDILTAIGAPWLAWLRQEILNDLTFTKRVPIRYKDVSEKVVTQYKDLCFSPHELVPNEAGNGLKPYFDMSPLLGLSLPIRGDSDRTEVDVEMTKVQVMRIDGPPSKFNSLVYQDDENNWEMDLGIDANRYRWLDDMRDS